MKKFLVFLCVLALTLASSGIASASLISVDIYSGHGVSGGGAPYSGLVGSFLSPDIMFATNTGYAWHPFGLSDFGAEMNGYLSVGATASYTFSLNSDDGSMLYIDGGLIINNGGAHGPTTASATTSLTSGLHTFKVEFFEDYGGPSGVDLYLPTGVAYSAPVPEPATMLLLASGLVGLVGTRRKFKT